VFNELQHLRLFCFVSGNNIWERFARMCFLDKCLGNVICRAGDRPRLDVASTVDVHRCDPDGCTGNCIVVPARCECGAESACVIACVLLGTSDWNSAPHAAEGRPRNQDFENWLCVAAPHWVRERGRTYNPLARSAAACSNSEAVASPCHESPDSASLGRNYQSAHMYQLPSMCT